MAGRVSQVSFHDGKLLVFERNDSPLVRGRLQNAKLKEQVQTRIVSELPELSQKTAKMARRFFWLSKSGLHCGFGVSGLSIQNNPFCVRANRPPLVISMPYMMEAAEVFHTMENYFAIFPHNGKNVSTVWKTRV